MQNFINHLKKYISLTDEELQILSTYVKASKVNKKTFLLEDGQICKANYFVEQGLLRMFFINDKGVEQVTQFALENWWMSDYMSLMMQSPSQFYIQAVEDTEIIVIAHHVEEDLFKELPQLERYFRIVIQRAYAAAQMRVKYFHDYSKEENYRVFVGLFPEFVQRIPQYMLASYLGLTPEYLSELRKKQL
ncbi:MAG: Crp/Fnr family transcriptional regulator [Bacteroidota bacterium]